MTDPEPDIDFDNSYFRELDGFYAPWKGEVAPAPMLVQFNSELAEELGLDVDALDSEEGAAIFSGSRAPEGAAPLAQVYAGHQFGGFSPQLGDGRALLIGEVIDRHGRRRDIHLKGSGRTPFSRGGDGKAVLGPVLREYLLGEAMHALGVPTTRALAAVTTGELVFREGPKPGAVLARVASSHLRVGTFQFFAARGEWDRVAQLLDYSVARHFPHVIGAEDKAIQFLRAVVDGQAELVSRWLEVGFVHGVMNTDNTAISGETIDYGPCAFLDAYDPLAVFSSIDHGGRYAFARQPAMAQWNLARLAETLLRLVDPDDMDRAIERCTEEVNAFSDKHAAQWIRGMGRKLGIADAEDSDAELIERLLQAMHEGAVDYTSTFRRLADAARGDDSGLLALFDDPSAISAWLTDWRSRLEQDPQSAGERTDAMNAVNPVYIPRNFKVEQALHAAEDGEGDLGPFKKLLEVLAAPFDPRPGLEEYEDPAPEGFGPYQTYCGT